MADIKDQLETSPTEALLRQFGRFETQARQQPSWVYPLRKAGMARFAELGFPTTQDEDWRFTNAAPIAKLPFHPPVEPSGNELKGSQIGEFTFSTLAARRLVFVNGFYAPGLSAPGGPLPGVTLSNLSSALATTPELLEQHLGRYVGAENNAFGALNTAFFQDGTFLHVAKGRVVEEPIHVLHVTTRKEMGATFSLRNLFLLEEGSRATVIESYASTVNAAYFTNAVTEIVAGQGSIFEHLKYQDESLSAFHVASIHAHLGRSSNAILHSAALGAKLSRNNIRAALQGEGLECVLNGLYLTKGDQLADHHMVVEHAQPHCASHEYYNGILDGRSKGVFHGRILVRQLAQKTDAKQTNKNLLLSDEATVDTKPQLEIYADDVKCTHGATVGQLNEESIFYLRARGIGAETARRMLIHSFAGEIIERVRHRPARDELDRLIWDRLEANPHVGQSK